jgi:hypothetical protein
LTNDIMPTVIAFTVLLRNDMKDCANFSKQPEARPEWPVSRVSARL